VLPEGVTRIGDQAFYYSESLESINIPASLVTIGEEAFYSCRALTQLVIPETVNTIKSSAFSGCYNLTVFAKAQEKPSGWSNYWLGGADVLWGYTGENVIYTFVTPEGVADVESLSSTLSITIPEAPEYEGYVFMGWFDNDAFSGAPLTGEYYNPVKNTLYARYITEAQYIEEMLKGTSMEYAYEGVSGGYYTGTVDKGGKVYIKVTVEAGETWNILTNHIDGYSNDHAIWIYDENGNDLEGRMDSGYTEDMDYTFSEAGTYYIAVGYWSSYNDGTIGVTVTKQ
jgi:hypothetical protein